MPSAADRKGQEQIDRIPTVAARQKYTFHIDEALLVGHQRRPGSIFDHVIFRGIDDIPGRGRVIEMLERLVHPLTRQVAAMIRNHKLPDQPKPKPIGIPENIDEDDTRQQFGNFDRVYIGTIRQDSISENRAPIADDPVHFGRCSRRKLSGPARQS